MAVDALEEFGACTIQDILNADSRPTLLLDLDPDVSTPVKSHLLHPIFCNAALSSHEQLLEAVTGADLTATSSKQLTNEHAAFKKWASGVTQFDDSKDVYPLSYQYHNLLWTGSTIDKRWRLISGNLLWRESAAVANFSTGPPSEWSNGSYRALSSKQQAADSPPAQTNASSVLPTDDAVDGAGPAAAERQKELKPFSFVKGMYEISEDSTTALQGATLALAAPEKSVTDWTVASPKGILTEHLKFARSVNWAATPLGPMESWTPEFRQVANLVMGNPHPAALFWGSELTLLYNQAYSVEIAGRKHPSLMGTGFVGPFREVWDSVAPVFTECARTGVSVRRDDDYITLERHGLMEETFFSWSITPLYGGGKRILGFYNAPHETTKTTISHRRLQTINNLGEKLARCKSVKQFWQGIMPGLEENHFDVPFALLYAIGDAEDADCASTSSGSTMSSKSCYLKGSVGIPENHAALPKIVDLKRSQEGFIPAFREAMRTREPTLLSARNGTFPVSLLEGISGRGFGDPCREAIVFPVRPTNGEAIVAFLLVGVNTRRLYDDDYKTFANMLNRQLATSLASVLLFEEEVRRSREAVEAATLQQQQLTQALALQTSRMRRMTESSPLGMYLLSPKGVIDEANDRFLEMTGMRREEIEAFSWVNIVEGIKDGEMEERWSQMLGEGQAWTGELQLKKSIIESRQLDGEEIDYWVLVSSCPEFAGDGSLISVMGSITDISHLKWAQGLQNRRLQEAEETRRQQNEFIDMTSHEMRNPLSAILQCADDISSGLEEFLDNQRVPPAAVIAECVEAAHTISLCVQHQKAIVDDILTVSKLDSNLLLLNPSPTQPLAVVKRAVKMFDSELQAKDIKVKFEQSPSIQELQVDWAILDPSRVLQILINFMTNAIKFTAASEKRLITVSVGASCHAPLHSVTTRGFEYIPARPAPVGARTSEEWGHGDDIYLRFKVADTGCGLTTGEKQVLFERFKQASPRTHAQYGGSGLGLFISRQLAELHGGRIGVASEAGVGSTFGFFITAKRAERPKEAVSPGELPIALEKADANSLFQQFQAAQENHAPVVVSTHLSKLRSTTTLDPSKLWLLVVEDNLINQKVLVNQLKKVGCTVSSANDGVEALAFLERTVYRRDDGQQLDAILMDLEMPNMDGLTCVRHIRTMQNEGKISKHVPVLAVTANVRDEQVIVAKRSGMDDVVSKPFRLPDLFKKLETVLRPVQKE